MIGVEGVNLNLAFAFNTTKVPPPWQRRLWYYKANNTSRRIALDPNTQPPANTPPLTPLEPAADSKIPSAALTLAIISFVTVVPVLSAIAFGLAGVIGARNPKDKKKSITALLISIVPFIVFGYVSALTLSNFMGGGEESWKGVFQAGINGGIVLGLSALVMLAVGIIIRKKTSDSPGLKQGKVLIVIGAVVLLTGALQVGWTLLPASQNVWIEGRIRTLADGGNGTTEPEQRAALEAKYYASQRNFEKGDVATFGEVELKVLEWIEVVVPYNPIVSIPDNHKLVILGIEARSPENPNEAQQRVIEALDISEGRSEGLKLIAGGTKYSSEFSEGTYLIEVVDGTWDKNSTLSTSRPNYSQDKLLSLIGGEKFNEVLQFSKKYSQFVSYVVKQNHTPQSLEFKLDVRLLGQKLFKGTSLKEPKDFVWTLKL